MKCKTSLCLIVLFCLMLSFCYSVVAAVDKKLQKISVKVVYSPQRDIGFLIAALLDLQDAEIGNINQKAVRVLMETKTKISLDKNKANIDLEKLAMKLQRYPNVQKLIKIPGLFDNFEDTIIAFQLILGEVTVNNKNRRIYNILNNTIFIEYPYLENLDSDEIEVGKELVDCISSEYTKFCEVYYVSNKSALQKTIVNYREAWQKEFEPSVINLNIEGNVKRIEIILTPVLLKHDNMYRFMMDGIGTVTSLLPSNEIEQKISLMIAYYKICYGIADISLNTLTKNVKKQKNANIGEDYLLLLSNSANQLMFEGLKTANPELLEEFFDSKYGDLDRLLENDLLEKSIEATGRRFTDFKLKELKNNLKKNPKKAIRDFYQNGYLVTIPFFEKFRGKLLPKQKINVDTEAAFAMYKVILAINGGQKPKSINELIDSAFECEAYKLANKDYTAKLVNKMNRISLVDFKKFLIDLSEGQISPLGNISLQAVAANYVELIQNPGKYLVSIEEYNSIPLSFYQKALDAVEKWLPKKSNVKEINVWVLFNMKPYMQTFENNIYVDVFTWLDSNGNVDKNLYYHALCYAIYKLGYNSQVDFKKRIDYYNLPGESKLKMFTYFLDNSVSVGVAGKLSFNLPGVISKKINPKSKTFWGNKEVEASWMLYEKQSLNVFKQARQELRDILSGKYKTFDMFIKDYDTYWMYYNKDAGRAVVSSYRRAYLGAELMGVIYDAYGKKGMLEATSDLFKVIPMFNKALLKTKPENYEKYLFPDDIVNLLNEEFLSKTKPIKVKEIVIDKPIQREALQSSEKKSWIARNIGIL